jgi:hypothetical protein
MRDSSPKPAAIRSAWHHRPPGVGELLAARSDLARTLVRDAEAAARWARSMAAAMVRLATALHPNPIAGTPVNAEWVQDAAGRVLAVMEEHRSTWQIWHVRAEAQRQVRAVELQAAQSARLVDLLIGDVLGNLSVSLARPNDGITEPAVLRRSDGTSVYSVALSAGRGSVMRSGFVRHAAPTAAAPAAG